MVSRIITVSISNAAVTEQKLGAGVSLPGPRIANVQPANSSYSANGSANVSTSGGYIIINGAGFVNGCTVIIGTANATSVTYVSDTVVNAQVAGASAGTYFVYLVNPNGLTAIGVNQISLS